MKKVVIYRRMPNYEENVIEMPNIQVGSNSPYNLAERKLKKLNMGQKKLTLFIVDDDPIYLKALKHFILNKLPQLNIKTFLTGEECLEQIKSKPNIIVLDYLINSSKTNAQNGLVILDQIKKTEPETKVIMLSSQHSLEIALECIRKGSLDYIAKNKFAFDNLNKVLVSIIENYKNAVISSQLFPLIFFKDYKIFLN